MTTSPTPDTVLTGDCLDILRQWPDDCVDLVVCSPPYEDARTYGIGYALRGDAWVEWCLPRFRECLRVCRGLVAWVVEGRTRNYRYSMSPMKLAVRIEAEGACPRKPLAYRRSGIPGSGGPDWFRNDWEWVLCFTRRQGRLPWSDNTACGAPPKYGPGGPPSHRTRDGYRCSDRRPNGELKPRVFYNPAVANPGNMIAEASDVIDCGASGGHHLGSKLAHENEAPFPERLVERLVRSCCPPGGLVLDCFGGSGTTAAVAKRWGRRFVSIDIRPSQTELTHRRLEVAHAV